MLGALLVAACAAVLAACPAAPRERTPAPVPPAPPNILLIVVDTLGAEWVGAYGAPAAGAAATPHLDGLSARGVRFAHAYSTAPWTQPAVASLLSGRMPSEHGLVRLFGTVPEDLPWLPSRLLDAGYLTAGVVSHKLVGRRYGFARGFASWDESVAGGAKPVTSARVTETALEWLADWRHGSPSPRPFFLLVHYFDPHYVYRHHAEHDRTSGYSGPLVPGMGIWDLRDARAGLTPRDVGYLRGLYAEEVAYTDAQIGRLLAGLERLGVGEQTAIVVTADHGEELMRHGWIGHTRTLYDELLRVPLMIVPPGGAAAAGAVVEEPVSLVDLAPSLLQLAGLEPGALGAPGLAGQDPVSLLPLFDAAPAAGQSTELRRRLGERALLAEVSYAAAPTDEDAQTEKTAFKIAAFDSRYKVIRDLSSGRWEVYDRADDPHELRPIEESAARGPEFERLVRRVQQLEAARRASPGRTVDLLTPSDEELERLRSLGYLR